MKKLLSLILGTALLSCSTPSLDENSRFSYEAEGVGVYVRLFQNEAASRGLEIGTQRLRIYVVDKFSEELRDEGTIGLCVYSGDKRTVFLDKRTLNTYSSYQREMLVFHELGHCLLLLGHDESTDEDGIPLSLMYPANFNSSYYVSSRKYYLDQMFEKVLKRLRGGSSEGRENYSCKWGKHKRSQKRVHAKR